MRAHDVDAELVALKSALVELLAGAKPSKDASVEAKAGALLQERAKAQQATQQAADPAVAAVLASGISDDEDF
jgi:hypothetical protein